MFQYNGSRYRPFNLQPINEMINLMMKALSLNSLVFAISISVTVFSGCKSSNQPTNLVELGNQYAKDGLLREAADTYKRALNTNPNNHSARRNLGLVLVKLGDYEQAISQLEAVVPYFENNFDSQYFLAEAFRAREKYAEAIFRYQTALKIRPRDEKALKALAWSYFKIRYYSEAMTTVKRLKRVNHRDEQATIISVRTLLKLKRKKEALAELRKGKRYISKATKPYFYSVEGDIRYQLGQTEKALKSYQAALKDQPLLAGALLGMGRIHYDQKNPKLAIKYLERAVRIRPKLIDAHLILGKAYENINKSRSIKYYRQFYKLASTDPEYLNQLGEVKTRMGQLKSVRNGHPK